MSELDAGWDGPADARNQDPRLRADVLEFLRAKAFPTWDFFDTTARRQLLREYPGLPKAESVARGIADAGPLLPHLVQPGPFRPEYQIGVTALQPPEPVRGGLFGRVRRPDNSPEARDSGVAVMVLHLSALGPFGIVTQMVPKREVDPLLDLGTLESRAGRLLESHEIAVLTRDESLVTVRGMRGIPYGRGGAVPNVCSCLFDEVAFRMRGLQGTGFRLQPSTRDDLWPPIDDVYS